MIFTQNYFHWKTVMTNMCCTYLW